VAPELSLRSRLASMVSGGGFASARGMMWAGTARVIRDNPFTGSGTDTLTTSFLRHAPAGYASIEGLGSSARKAHDEPLHFWATLGVLGLAAYIWILVSAGASARPFLSDPLRAGISAAVCAYLLHNLFSFGTAATSPAAWLMIGFLSRNRREAAGAPRPRIWNAVPGAMAAILALWGMLRFTADGWAYRGNEASIAGRDAESAEGFARARLLAPWDLRYLVRQAGALEGSGRKGEALTLFERASAFNPANGILLGNAARVQMALAPAKDRPAREQALARMMLAVEMAPTQPTLYGAVIMALQEMKRLPERDAWVSRLRTADPGWASKMLGTPPPGTP